MRVRFRVDAVRKERGIDDRTDRLTVTLTITHDHPECLRDISSGVLSMTVHDHALWAMFLDAYRDDTPIYFDLVTGGVESEP